MMNCTAARARLDDWLDDALDASQTADLDRHLALCRNCARLFQSHRALESDLLQLGRAADRIAVATTAAAPRRAAPRRNRLLPRILRIAAAIAIVAAAAWTMRGWPSKPGEPVVPIAKTPARQLKNDALESVRLASAPRVEMVEADGRERWIVPIASSNPRITIVWAYDAGSVGDARRRTAQ